MKTETALITGASSGIGLHLAHEFAGHGYSVVLVAPVESELQAIATELSSKHGITARALAANLEDPTAPQAIFAALQSDGVEIDILVNNAGHGFHGPWSGQPLEQDLSMLRLNVEAVLRLTKLFLPPMLQRGRGRILNTASVVGFEPGPLLATYSATKAFVLSWSEALATELAETPITVTALCPGVTDTDFFKKGGSENIKARQSENVMAPQEVAKIGYEALINAELFVVAGAANKAMIAARRILPVTAQAKMNMKLHQEVPPEERTHYRGEKEDADATHN